MNSLNVVTTATRFDTKIRTAVQAAIFSRDQCHVVNTIYDETRRRRIAASGELLPLILSPATILEQPDLARHVEVLFTCWGLPADFLTPEFFPSLQLVLYSGGSVKGFAQPLLERGVQVVGARVANAVPVANFCLAQIILSCKGYFQNARPKHLEAIPWNQRFRGPGLYGEAVSLLGMGATARELAVRLQQCDMRVLVMDPYVTPREAEELGVELVSMEAAFASGYVVSNHLPDLPQLQRVLNKRLFLSMRPNATFINTGRGAQVNEDDLLEVAQLRPDFTALLDVTDPEPPPAGSPLYQLPNIQISSHIAGAINSEILRLGDFVIEEFERYASGSPLLYADSLELLARLA